MYEKASLARPLLYLLIEVRMEILEQMSPTQFLYRLFLCMLAAMVVVGIAAEWIGEERRRAGSKSAPASLSFCAAVRWGKNFTSVIRAHWKESVYF